MLSFEFSVFDLVLSIGVVVLLILFLTTLWKLNPSKEDERQEDEGIHNGVYEQEQEPTLTSRQPTLPYDSRQGADRVTSQTAQTMPKLVVSTTAEGSTHESLEQMPRQAVDVKEPPKPSKTTISTKQNAKSFDVKDCLHYFGYLGGLPKNTPIPGECFGCQKIVDCLITRKGK